MKAYVFEAVVALVSKANGAIFLDQCKKTESTTVRSLFSSLYLSISDSKLFAKGAGKGKDEVFHEAVGRH